jgi:hypothetical protein
VYTVSRDNVFKEVKRGLVELAFFDPGGTATISQRLDDLANVLSVFFLIFGKDQDVVKVGDVGAVDIRS